MNTTEDDDSHPMLVWAIENLARGADPDAMFKTMLDSGWGWRDANIFLEKACALWSATAPAPLMPSMRAELRAPGGCPDGQPARVAMRLSDPEVALVENFVSASEAEALIELGKARLARSTTVDDHAPSATQTHPDRSSSGASLDAVAHPAIASVLSRAAWAFGWPREHFEPFQILRYLPGQEYKAHHDWFDPSTPGGLSQTRFGGQRVATAVIYLNDCPSGGSTCLPQLGLRAAPRAGNALFFAYDCDDRLFGDGRLLHSGEPVLEGEKWVCTLWLRQRPYPSHRG